MNTDLRYDLQSHSQRQANPVKLGLQPMFRLQGLFMALWKSCGMLGVYSLKELPDLPLQGVWRNVNNLNFENKYRLLTELASIIDN